MDIFSGGTRPANVQKALSAENVMQVRRRAADNVLETLEIRRRRWGFPEAIFRLFRCRYTQKPPQKGLYNCVDAVADGEWKFLKVA